MIGWSIGNKDYSDRDKVESNTPWNLWMNSYSKPTHLGVKPAETNRQVSWNSKAAYFACLEIF